MNDELNTGGVWGDAFASPSNADLEARRFDQPASGLFGAPGSGDWFGARTSAAAGQAGEYWTPTWLWRQRNNPAVLQFAFGEDHFERTSNPLLTPDEANRLYGIEGALSFTQGTTHEWAADRHKRTRRELWRQDVMSRAEGGNMATDLAAALAVGVTDPINFIFPFGRIGALRSALPAMAAAEVGEAVLPRMLASGGFGAIEGAAFSLALEPALFGVAQIDQAGLGDRVAFEYGLEQSLLNIAIGAGFNGGVNFLLGAARPASFDRELAADRALMPASARDANPDVREAAAHEAAEALAEGRPSRAGEMFAAADAARLTDFLPGDAIRHRPVHEADVYTPAGGRERALYAIVEIDDLVTSHSDALAINDAYPQALQPRDRTRAASEAQLHQFGAPFDAARWGETFQGDAGAPIAGSDGVVESGNARTIWMRRAYRAGDARTAEYKAWLAAEGYPIEGFNQPFLVRLTDADRDVASRVRFAEELNKPASAVMSVTETAFADARRFDAAILEQHQGGAVGAIDNVGFTRAALANLASESELGGMIDAGGRLSKNGEQRLEAALMARAYGDADLVAMRFETLDDELKTVGGALADAAPAMARLAVRIDAGEVSADFDLRAPLQAAAGVLRQARRQGKSVKSFLREIADQGDMFDAGLSPRTLDMLQILVDNGARVRARAKIAGALDVYAKAAEASPAPVMFDEARIDYGRALETAGRTAGEPALRPSDGPSPQGGGRNEISGGASPAERFRASRDAVARSAQEALAPRYGADAAPMARLWSSALGTIGEHFGETAEDVASAINARIVDKADLAAAGGGRRFNQALRGASVRERWVAANVTKRRIGSLDNYTFASAGDGVRDVTVTISEKGRIDIVYKFEDVVREGASPGGEAVRVFTNAFNVIMHDIATQRRPVYTSYAANDVLGQMYARLARRYLPDYRVEVRGAREMVLHRLSMKERRARAAEIKTAERAVARADRQAIAFLAAAECAARHGLGAAGHGMVEALAGTTLGAGAALPLAWLGSHAVAANAAQFDPSTWTPEDWRKYLGRLWAADVRTGVYLQDRHGSYLRGEDEYVPEPEGMDFIPPNEGIRGSYVNERGELVRERHPELDVPLSLFPPGVAPEGDIESGDVTAEDLIALFGPLLDAEGEE